MEDKEILEFLRRQGQKSRYVTSVCTGALVLGAAGLLKGYRATTHWASLDLLPVFGAKAVTDRVVVDRNRITGGGVTAGIDFGLTVAAAVFGDKTAKTIQLGIEDNPRASVQLRSSFDSRCRDRRGRASQACADAGCTAGTGKAGGAAVLRFV